MLLDAGPLPCPTQRVSRHHSFSGTLFLRPEGQGGRGVGHVQMHNKSRAACPVRPMCRSPLPPPYPRSPCLKGMWFIVDNPGFCQNKPAAKLRVPEMENRQRPAVGRRMGHGCAEQVSKRRKPLRGVLASSPSRRTDETNPQPIKCRRRQSWFCFGPPACWPRFAEWILGLAFVCSQPGRRNMAFWWGGGAREAPARPAQPSVSSPTIHAPSSTTLATVSGMFNEHVLLCWYCWWLLSTVHAALPNYTVPSSGSSPGVWQDELAIRSWRGSSSTKR